jgi:REP element-mobilizing transposase RayT
LRASDSGEFPGVFFLIIKTAVDQNHRLNAAIPPDTIRQTRTNKNHASCADATTGEHAMPSTYLSLHYHIVFGTKLRAPLIRAEWQSRLHDYLGGMIRGLGGIPQAVGGIADHVHLLFGLKATHCLADVMRELKKASSVWVHDELGDRNFAWQEGYAAFTVSATARASVCHYIENQAEHHRQKTFREELLEMLERAEVAFDPQYFD